ncbi:MAG: GEVED domain-containing protein, partial [Planctomycetia bacterium]|nr:GEVED domain-containing protein [Planctomycetia bacterium]
LLRRDGALLTEGVDYFFSYDSLNNIARFTAAQGIWTSGSSYTITVNNSVGGGIQDIAGNTIKPNNLQGETSFLVNLATADFGDAPDPDYPTVIASQGAVHVLSPTVFLGAGVTSDNDGQPSSGATGDIDDGVQFASQLFAGQATSVVVNASVAGKLDAWVDFNRDGDWNDAGEKVFTNRSVIKGNNLLTINVPVDAVTGETFARFRFSTAGGLNPTGLAQDGEVEDYQIDIASAAAYSIVVTSPEGKELGKDIDGRYGVGPGSEVQINVYVDDQRLLASGGGVRAAFADLVASSNTLEFIAASLKYGPTFTTSLAGTINVAAGIVDEAGGVGANPTGTDRQLLFSVRGRIKTNAAVGSVVDLTTDAADAPTHTTQLYGSDTPVPPAFGFSSLVVLENPYKNPANAFDVNNDGIVSGLDALVLINRLNANGGPVNLPIPVTTSQPPYYDPTGDNRLTALDVLQVINEINRRTAAARAQESQGIQTPTPTPSSFTSSQVVAATTDANVITPAFAGAFLPTTLSVANSAPEAELAVDSLFAADFDDDDQAVGVAVSDDVWADDTLTEEIAAGRPRSAAHADELASLWIHETQDWTSSARETIVEKKHSKRWL